MTFNWESLADGVFRCRLPFLDVTVGVVWGRDGVLLVDSGTTPTEAKAIEADIQHIAQRRVTHILLTHNHFDHILGASFFDGAEIYCAPEVTVTMAERADHLRADALRHGADQDEVERAIAALRVPDHSVNDAVIDLGDRSVAISHPGRGHTDHDLIAVVSGVDRTVVFCGDLVEESGDPSIGADSDPVAWPATLDTVVTKGGPDALFVPGHGALVDESYIRWQQRWFADL